MFTKQQTFDMVARHLLTQNKRAANGGRCRYKIGNLQCAAGCLIPHDKYNPDYEGKGVHTLCENHEWSSFFGHDIDLLVNLQHIHDHYMPRLWEAKLVELGLEEGLDITRVL